MTAAAILNYDGGPAGNRVWEVTGLMLERVGGLQTLVDQRIERYTSICNTLGTGGYASVAAVTPGDSSVVLSGTQVCSNYVGNNAIAGWTCLGVPYVYQDYPSQTASGKYFGTDTRPTWNSCSAALGSTYRWLDPARGTGVMMACCGHP